MSKIVVAKLYRLGRDGDSFTKKFKTTLRESVKIDDEYITNFNKNWQSSGQLYEIDEKATKTRNEKLNPKPKGRPKKEETK